MYDTQSVHAENLTDKNKNVPGIYKLLKNNCLGSLQLLGRKKVALDLCYFLINDRHHALSSCFVLRGDIGMAQGFTHAVAVSVSTAGDQNNDLGNSGL